MDRTAIIQSLIDKNNYQTYLEIGLSKPERNYLKIRCKNKFCVDPYEYSSDDADAPQGDEKKFIEKYILTHKMCSDYFFDTCNGNFDIVFIDGLHESEQVYRDICNSLRHLSENGIIVVHDSLPASEIAQEKVRQSVEWNGDVWRALFILKQQGLNFSVVDTDYGVAVIQYKDNLRFVYDLSNETIDGCSVDDSFTYSQVFSNKAVRDCCMNVISEDEFERKYLK